jgi:uncharacterized protein YdhG (YjbR/CyaY superfamily)
MDVDTYIEHAPDRQRPVLEKLRAKIKRHIPDAVEEISPNGFPVYTIGGEWIAGFATRDKGPMLYIMAGGVLDRHADELGNLRSGQSCIEWKDAKHLPLEELDKLADLMLDEAAKATA